MVEEHDPNEQTVEKRIRRSVLSVSAAISRFIGGSIVRLVLVVIVLIIAALVFATQTSVGRAMVLRTVVGVVNTAVLDGELEVGRLRGTVFGHIRLEDITLRDPEGVEVLRADALDVRYSLRALLDGRIVVDSVEAVRPDVTVRAMADGRLNVAALVPAGDAEVEQSGSGGIDLEIVSIIVSDGRADLQIASVVLDAISIDGSFSLGVDSAIEAHVGRLRTTATVSTLGELPMEIDGVDFSMSGASMNAAIGSISAGEARLREFDARLDANPEALSVPPFAASIGELAVDPAFFERLALSPAPAQTLVATLDASSRGAVVEAAMHVEGPSVIEIGATFEGSEATWTARVAAPSLQPALWVSAADSLPPDLRASLVLLASGRGIDPATMQASATLTGEGIEALGQRLDDLRVDAHVDGGTLFVERLLASGAGVELAVRGRGELSGELAASAQVVVADVGGTAAHFVPDLRAGGSVAAQVSVAATVDERLTGLFAEIDPARWAREVAPLLGLRARFDGRDLVVPGLSVDQARLVVASPRGPTLAAVVNAHVAGVVAGGAPLVDTASAKLTADSSSFRLTLDASEASARRSVTLRTSGTLEESLITLRPEQLALTAGELGLRLTSLPTWRTALTESGGIEQIDIGSTRFDVVGAPVAVEGRWRPDGQVRAHVTADSVEIADLTRLFALPIEVAGRVTAAIDLDGSLESPRMNASIGWVDGQVGPVDSIGLDVRTNYARSVLRADISVTRDDRQVIVADTGPAGLPVTVDLAAGGWRLRGRDAVQASLRVNDIDLAELAAVLPDLAAYEPEGRVGAVVELAGTWGDPAVGLQAQAVDLAADITQIDGVTWRVDDVDSTLDVNITAGTGGSMTLALQVDEGGVAFARASGSAAINVEELLGADDLLAAVERSSFELDVVLPSLAAKRVPPAVRDALGLRGGALTAVATIDGLIGDPQLQIEAFADRVEVDGVPPISARIESELGAALEVRLLAVAGDAAMADVWSLLPMDGNVRTAALDDRSRGDAALRVDARIAQSLGDFVDNGLSLTRPIEARVHVPRGVLGPLIPTESAAFPGRLAGYLDVTGSVLAPSVSGRFAWRDVTLADGADGMVGVEIDARDMRADIGAFVCSGEGRVLTADARVRVPTLDRTASGSWTLPGLEEWGITAQVNADAAPLGQLVPAALIDGVAGGLEGLLDADVTVAGTFGAPRIDGTLAIREGAATLAATGVRYSDVAASVSLSNEAIELTTLAARSGNGSVDASGRIDLDDFSLQGGHIAAQLRRFDASAFAGTGLVVGGDVTVDLGVVDDWLNVDVGLSGMAIDIPSNSAESGGGPTAPAIDVNFIGEDVAATEVGSRAPAALVVEEDATAGGSSLRARVTVASEGRNTLRASVAEVDWEVDLGIELEGDDLTLEGMVRVPSGRVTVAGKPFDITRGFVTFDGGANEIDPVVDIRAVHEFSADVAARLEPSSSGTASVTVIVDGTLSELTAAESNPITLVSDPEMTPEDIIFVLLTGRPRDDGGDVDAQQQALATAGSLMLGFLSDRIAGGLPIDTLRVSSDTQTGQAISRVEGGKYLSEDVYLSGAYINSQDPEENNFELSVEWIIARIGRATVGTSLRAGDRGRGGLELLYTLIRPGRISARVEREQRTDDEVQQ